MPPEEFRYDLAISFVAKDEVIATQIADQFEGRLSVFLYSREQEQLAGTDGEKTFNEVFAKQSRLVVVLYRAGWGETPWTRIEETAIRNRAFDEGYGFVLFIPLDDQPSVPRWLPRTQLWIGLERWGVSGAASVIDARFQELGGLPQQETIEHRAARLEKAVNFSTFRKRYLSTEAGVSGAKNAFEELAKQIAVRVPRIQESAPSLGVSVKQANNILVLCCSGNGLSLRVCWKCRFTNSLTDAVLDVSVWNGHPPFPGMSFWEEPRAVEVLTFNADVLPTEEAVWIVNGASTNELLLPDAAAEFILDWWLGRSMSHQSSSY